MEIGARSAERDGEVFQNAAISIKATAASWTIANGERLTMDTLGRGLHFASWYAPPTRTFGCEYPMLRRSGQPVLPLAMHKYKVSPLPASSAPARRPLLIQELAGSLLSYLPFRARLEVGRSHLQLTVIRSSVPYPPHWHAKKHRHLLTHYAYSQRPDVQSQHPGAGPMQAPPPGTGPGGGPGGPPGPGYGGQPQYK